jgi:multiple sugar transport system substrate-binding protein
MDKLLTLEGGIGCRKSTWSDEEVNARIPFYHCLEELHEEARELPRRCDWSQLAAVMDAMVLDAVTSEESTTTILQRAERRAKEVHLEGVRNA